MPPRIQRFWRAKPLRIQGGLGGEAPPGASWYSGITMAVVAVRGALKTGFIFWVQAPNWVRHFEHRPKIGLTFCI